jgi:hypothetical protein
MSQIKSMKTNVSVGQLTNRILDKSSIVQAVKKANMVPRHSKLFMKPTSYAIDVNTIGRRNQSDLKKKFKAQNEKSLETTPSIDPNLDVSISEFHDA